MVADVVGDTLDLMATKLEHETMEYFVLDFTDVFFKLPLNVSEWPYFAAHYKDTRMRKARGMVRNSLGNSLLSSATSRREPCILRRRGYILTRITPSRS